MYPYTNQMLICVTIMQCKHKWLFWTCLNLYSIPGHFKIKKKYIPWELAAVPFLKLRVKIAKNLTQLYLSLLGVPELIKACSPMIWHICMMVTTLITITITILPIISEQPELVISSTMYILHESYSRKKTQWHHNNNV